MQFKKIYGPARIDSQSNGAEQTVKLSPTPGGRMVKNVQYMCKVLASSGANVRISIELWHSPDGGLSRLHSAPISGADPSADPLLVGDSDPNKMIGEFLMAVIKIKDSANTTAQWASIELFEMRKPF